VDSSIPLAVDEEARRKGEWCDKYGFWHDKKNCARDAFLALPKPHSPKDVPQTAADAAKRGIPFMYKIKCWTKFSQHFAANEKFSVARYPYYANLVPPTCMTQQIAIDLPRIWPGHPAFRESASLSELHLLLRAISNAIPTLGYCQSMGPIAAALLLLADAPTAFELCIRLFDKITPEYHSATMEGLQIDIQVLSELLRSRLPRLYVHLKNINVDVVVPVSKWFMVFSQQLFLF